LLAGRAAHTGRRWDEAIHRYREALAHAPRCAEAHARIAEAYLFQNTPATATNALAAYQQSLDMNPRDAAVVFSMAMAQQQLGDTNQAFAAFRRAFALDPHNADYWTEFGRLQERLGNNDDAMRAYQKAVDGHHPDANHLLQRLRRRIENQNR